MRAIVCWPIQYLTALGIASQSPGYLPNAEYISAQMKRKISPAVRIGTRCRRIHATVEAAADETPAAGLPKKARSRKTQNPKATNETPVMYAIFFVPPGR